jgi:hypothetical protein
MTETDIGKAWDKVASNPSPTDYSSRADAYGGVDQAILGKVKEAIKTAPNKADAVQGVQDRINEHVKVEGGPLLSYNSQDNSLRITHLRPATGEEQAKINELKDKLGFTDEQLQKKEVYHASAGSEGKNQRDCYLVPDAPPRTYKVNDRVDEVGQTGKPSGELSKEFPSPYVIAKAWEAMGQDAAKALSRPGVWNPTNPEQKFFADQLPQALADLHNLPDIIKLDGKASRGTPEPVNAFLKQKGFDIKLEDSGSKDSTYVAGTLSIEDKWDSKARAQKLTANDGKTYDSVWKSGTVHEVNNQQVAEIQNQNGLRVFAIPAPQSMDGYKVQQKAIDMVGKIVAQEKAGLHGQQGKVEFPMVDMDSQQKLPGLVGLQSKDGYYSIDQALMQTKVQMDENGFKAKQAFAAEIRTRSIQMDPPTLMQVKDKFIFVAATEDGRVVFASDIGQQNWKRPPQTSDN